MSLINFPILYIPNPTVGRPLFSGQIFVGIEDLDPEIEINQKQLNVMQEDGTLIPVAQPFALSAGGVPVFNGQTVRLDVDGNYSLKILDKHGAQTYYIENVYEGEPITREETIELIEEELIDDPSQSYFFDIKADLSANTIVFPVNKILKTKGIDVVGDGLGKSYFVSATQITINDILMASGQYASLKELISTDVIAQKININTTALPVGLLKNQVGATQDRHVMFFGDSHGWGQGAPQYDLIGAPAGNVSVHSSPVENQGFIQRSINFLQDKLNTETNHYGGGSNQVTSDMTTIHAQDKFVGDPESGRPIIALGGNVSATYEVRGDVTETMANWFAPDTMVGNGDDYSYSVYRDKLQGGLFTRGVMRMESAIANDFTTIGRTRYWEILPKQDSVTNGAGLVDIVLQNLSSGAAQDPVLGARDTTTGRIWVNSAMKRPDWCVTGAEVYVPGYGYGLLGGAGALPNDSIEFQNPDGSPATNEFSKLITSGTKIYPATIARGLLMIEMNKPARACYVSVIEQSGGGKMRFGFLNSINNGVTAYPRLDNTATYNFKANPWSQTLSSNLMGIFKVEPDGNLTANPANTARDGFGVLIDTDNGGAAKEVVYRLDFGSQQQGRMFITFEPDDLVSFDKVFESRGVVFDNNKFQNYSMGGHTIGAWLGEEDSFSDETRDHVADILNYTPVQPSHIITQIPFVNEYLKQTPIATFKTRLQTFVDRFENHLPGTNNYNLVGVDFMFYTSLRNREIAFEGGAEDPVTYDMYVQATKEFCEDNNHAFVDCEQRLFDLVDNNRINYERLYNNSNHPSDYANEMIFETLKHEYLYAAVG